MDSGQPTIQGKVGEDVTSDEARMAARQAALNVIGIMSVACSGDVEKVQQVIRIGVYVNCTPDFSEQPKIANGASDLFVAVFGDRGRHARTAIGTNALPFNVPVEVDAVFTMVS